jgi:hypothetical protein
MACTQGCDVHKRVISQALLISPREFHCILQHRRVFKLGVDLKWVAEASREYVHLMLLDEALTPGH